MSLARWEPGQQLVYERNDAWTSGPLPGVKRVIVREVPNPATRRALIERGDVQMSCNVMAGAYHDHVFVPVARADEAMSVLAGLQAEARLFFGAS